MFRGGLALPGWYPCACFFNLEKPSEAVLERRAGSFKVGTIIGIVLLAISACIGCVMVVAIIRNFMG